MQTRRTLIAALAASVPTASLMAACGKSDGAGASTGSGSTTTSVTDDEVSMGDPKAPVVLVEYASVACPVCARFNIDIFPEFKKKYIDSGQVRYVSRELNAHNPALSTAGFLLARCAGKDKYFQVTDAIYRAQAQIDSTGDVRTPLLQIAKDAGLSEKEFTACITDPAAIDAQNTRAERLAKRDNITATPTFLINNEIVAEGFINMAQLDAIIATAKARGAAKPAA